MKRLSADPIRPVPVVALDADRYVRHHDHGYRMRRNNCSQPVAIIGRRSELDRPGLRRAFWPQGAL